MVKKSSLGSVVKKGGTKRKIPIAKIAKKESLAVAYTKRTGGLYSKTSQICLLAGHQIAILATPPSSESNVSFYSFGHSSVDAVVSAYLSGQSLGPVPSETIKQMKEEVGVCMAQRDLGLGFWWNEHIRETPHDLRDAMNSMSKLMTKLGEWGAEEVIDDHQGDHHHQEIQYEDLKFDDVVLHHENQVLDKTLNLQTESTVCCIPDDYLNMIVFSDNTEEQDQIQAIFDSFGVTDKPAETFDVGCSNNQEMCLDQSSNFDLVAYLEDLFSDEEESTESPLVTWDPNLCSVDVLMRETTNPNIEEESTVCCVTDKPAETFDAGCSSNHLDQSNAFDFGTYLESLFPHEEEEPTQSALVNWDPSLCSDSQLVDHDFFEGGANSVSHINDLESYFSDASPLVYWDPSLCSDSQFVDDASRMDTMNPNLFSDCDIFQGGANSVSLNDMSFSGFCNYIA